MKLANFFIDTTEQKILDFLTDNFGQSFYDKEIAQKAKISGGAANKALRNLAKSGLVLKETKGRMNFYQINVDSFVVKEFKVLKNVIQLSVLIKKLKEISEKIILFGSVSRGENYENSDIDLLVVAHNKEEIEKVIKKVKLDKLKSIVKTPAKFAVLEKKDPTFYQEIIRGIVLWEKYE